MKTSDLKNLTSEEILARLRETQKEYSVVRRAIENGKEKDHTKLKASRRLIARIKTIQQQNYDKA